MQHLQLQHVAPFSLSVFTWNLQCSVTGHVDWMDHAQTISNTCQKHLKTHKIPHRSVQTSRIRQMSGNWSYKYPTRHFLARRNHLGWLPINVWMIELRSRCLKFSIIIFSHHYDSRVKLLVFDTSQFWRLSMKLPEPFRRPNWSFHTMRSRRHHHFHVLQGLTFEAKGYGYMKTNINHNIYSHICIYTYT